MDWITFINTIVCCALAAAASWACLSPRVKDGIIIKLGLVGLALGFASYGYLVFAGLDVQALTRAQLVINAGVVVTVAGWWLRGRPGRQHVPERRASDFVELDDATSERP